MIARPLALLGLFVPIALCLLVGIVVVSGNTSSGPVYGVAEVEQNLARDPRQWSGRTILVRGEVVPCLTMPSAENGQCALLAPSGQPQRNPDATSDPLVVAYAGIDPLLAPLRHLPFLSDLLPAPQLPQWGVVATYRVHLRASANCMSGAGACYEAVLLDAAP